MSQERRFLYLYSRQWVASLPCVSQVSLLYSFSIFICNICHSTKCISRIWRSTILLLSFECLKRGDFFISTLVNESPYYLAWVKFHFFMLSPSSFATSAIQPNVSVEYDAPPFSYLALSVSREEISISLLSSMSRLITLRESSFASSWWCFLHLHLQHLPFNQMYQ